MKTIKAFGREFHASDDGNLLDVDGKETRFPVMDLDIKMDSRHGIQAFCRQAREGDHVATWGAKTGAAGDVVMPEAMLLIRNGRMVVMRDLSAMMVD